MIRNAGAQSSHYHAPIFRRKVTAPTGCTRHRGAALAGRCSPVAGRGIRSDAFVPRSFVLNREADERSTCRPAVATGLDRPSSGRQISVIAKVRCAVRTAASGSENMKAVQSIRTVLVAPSALLTGQNEAVALQHLASGLRLHVVVECPRGVARSFQQHHALQ